MIFVTVGTHEQPFDRLIKKVDELKRDGVIAEDVIMQIGFSTYQPQYCEYQKLFPYDEMQELVKEAHIVITHGGPSSFIMPLQLGKIPIVIPREYQYGEHVNDHQVEFSKAVNERYGNLIVITDVDQLGDAIRHYDETVSYMTASALNNNERFCECLDQIVNDLMKEKK